MTEYKNNNTFSFKITKKIHGKLRCAGIIHTLHGNIKTLAIMMVGAKGEVRFISMDDLNAVHAQVEIGRC